MSVLTLVLLALGAWYLLVRSNVPFSGFFPLLRSAPQTPSGEVLNFELPEGFTARLFSRDVPGARVMIRDPRGAILVSLTKEGSVVALPDENGDGVADSVIEVISGLNNPHGLAFVCSAEDSTNCTLYIAEEDAVYSYSYDTENKVAKRKEILVELPSGDGHYTRTLLPHPDGRRLLIAVGSSCNVCVEKDARRAAVLAVDLGTKESKVFATGLRNTVFMAIHPVTGEVWGADMGRDRLGDDLPPDEINIIREGDWYGWPWFYGRNVDDYNFSPNARPSFAQEAAPTHLEIQAHSAPLGIAFVPEEGWPEEYWHNLIVAFHGSWNRSTPTGYKLVRINLTPEGSFNGKITDFMTGFTKGGDIFGRPTGLLIEPGGVLYVADDRAGAVYRVTRDSID